MKTGNKVVITELIRKGFDMNAREYISATTPMFFLRDKLLYNELTRQNAQWKDVWDKEGHALRNLFSPTRGIPQVHVETLHVAVVGDVQYSPKARYSTAEGFILGATLPENHIYQQQQQQQQQQPQQRESLNRVTADPLRPDRFSWTSRTPSGAIAAYITGTSQSPQCTPSNSPLLSTSPALPSSSCRTRKRAGLAPSRYPIVWYDTLPGSGDTKLCVQIGDYHWYKERNEAVDIVIFAYTVADTHSLHSLVHDTMPDIIQHTGGGRRFRDRAGSGDDSSSSSSDSDSDSDSDKDSSSNDKGCRKWAQSVRKATYVLVGIGKEARSDPEMAANCAKMHSLLRTPVQCREIAEYCGMHGFMEWEQSPESFRALLYEAVKVHVARTTATTTAGADAQSSTLCGVAQVLRPPLPCEVRAKQAKVLFLGHQGTGKSSLLRHLVEEDAASKHRTFARLLKSTRGNSNSNNNSNSNDGDLNGSDENGGGGGGSSSSNSSKRGTTAAMTSLSLSSVNSHREVELNGLAQGCTVRVLDFAGQIECTSAYEIFFSSFNTLYVITVNAASPNTTAQLRHWLEVLEQSRHGPYTDAALLIVCTMIDLIPNGRDGATVKEVEVTHEVQAWEISKRMEVRVVLASSRTGEGIKTVASTIASYAQAIARHRVPRVFRKAQRAMTKFPPEAISVFCTATQLQTVNIQHT